jgi:hypothetical protein
MNPKELAAELGLWPGRAILESRLERAAPT